MFLSYPTCNAGNYTQATVSSFNTTVVSAVPTYMNYNQTFWLQPTLERWVNGAWTGTPSPWQKVELPAHQHACYYGLITYDPKAPAEVEVDLGRTWNVTPGSYRIRYEYRWYAGSTLLGWERDYASPSDIWAFGDRVSVRSTAAPNGSGYCYIW
jgi:hypothetical protein